MAPGGSSPGPRISLAAPAASATTAARPASARSTRRLGPSLVDYQIAVAEEAPVEHLDGLGRFFLRRHLDESEASRTPGELIGHDPNGFDRAGLLEQLTEILLRGLEGEVADEQLCGHR